MTLQIKQTDVTFITLFNLNVIIRFDILLPGCLPTFVIERGHASMSWMRVSRTLAFRSGEMSAIVICRKR